MIEHVLIVSLFTIGYCCTFWEGMIFEKIGDSMEMYIPEWINKPLWSCFICACMWWGTWVWAMLWYNNAALWYINLNNWFFTVVPAMGLNAVIARIIEKHNQ